MHEVRYQDRVFIKTMNAIALKDAELNYLQTNPSISENKPGIVERTLDKIKDPAEWFSQIILDIGITVVGGTTLTVILKWLKTKIPCLNTLDITILEKVKDFFKEIISWFKPVTPTDTSTGINSIKDITYNLELKKKVVQKYPFQIPESHMACIKKAAMALMAGLFVAQFGNAFNLPNTFVSEGILNSIDALMESSQSLSFSDILIEMAKNVLYTDPSAAAKIIVEYIKDQSVDALSGMSDTQMVALSGAIAIAIAAIAVVGGVAAGAATAISAAISALTSAITAIGLAGEAAAGTLAAVIQALQKLFPNVQLVPQ